MTYDVVHGDCLATMAAMEPDSVDAIVTDPPYALPGGFMGKEWDNFDGREDSGFGYWLAGFTDGEGCFRIQRHERGTHTCGFQIKLRRDDKCVLERIRRFVGHGIVRDVEGDGVSKPQVSYVVQDKDGCAALAAIFRKYPLAAKKAIDFEIWSEAVDEWLSRPRGNRWVGQSDQSRAAALKARLENVRRYTDIPWSGHKFQDWARLWAAAALRVAKPGAHLLAFGGTRTSHRLVCAIEDAGWEIRDSIAWVYGSGFPKSLNLRGEWSGWGTALKPAIEPICLARKPLVGTVAANVLRYGTGALNVDGCRVDFGNGPRGVWGAPQNVQCGNGGTMGDGWSGRPSTENDAGRWPANLIHDGSPEVLAVLGEAARFFYCAKASVGEREAGLDALPDRTRNRVNPGGLENDPRWAPVTRKNVHPTVKPIALMRYLCRLVTPRGGLVLDPFTGSGTTGCAAVLEGLCFVGCEMEAEYVEIARARIAYWQAHLEGPRYEVEREEVRGQMTLFNDKEATA